MGVAQDDGTPNNGSANTTVNESKSIIIDIIVQTFQQILNPGPNGHSTRQVWICTV